jgi:hypothetical protein
MLDADHIDIEDLPGTLREMAALIGLVPTLVLVRHYGGTRVYVPREIGPEHPLARLIGFEAAHRLAQHYGGLMQHFDVPRALDAMIQVRNREIRRKASMGMSHRLLALEYRMTERHVRNILGEEPAAETQAKLFGQ